METAPRPELFPAFQQSAAYAQAARLCGASVEWARLTDGGCQVGQALVLRRHGLRLISRGPLWDAGTEPRQRRTALRRFARSASLTLVTPQDDTPCGFGLVPLVTPLHHAVWSIGAEPASLLAAMQGKWRNRLRAALSAGVRVTKGTARTLDQLIGLEAAQRQARGYRALPASFLRALDPADLDLFRWTDQGALQAAMAFVRHGQGATYLMGWAGPRARAARAHNAMLWHAVLSLRARGITQLDLGTLDSENAPGLAHFKLGTGAALHRLGPTCLVLPG